MKPTHLLPGVWSEVLQANKIQEFVVTLIEVMDIRTQSQVLFCIIQHWLPLPNLALFAGPLVCLGMKLRLT